MEKIKEYIDLIPFGSIWTWAAGFLGSAAAALFGGWDIAVQALLIFIGVDIVSGLVVAGVFRKSGKTDGGALNSKAMWQGLLRKVFTLVIVALAAELDRVLDTHIFRDATVIAYIINELLSIIENVGLMGVPIPDAIKKAIEILKNKEEEHV